MKLCIIPARGGSKRIANKNIKNFCGKPIIAWSISAAIKSNIFDKIVVSTDNHEIAEISKRYGAEVPFTRPKSISDDFTGTIPVIQHGIKWINSNYQKVDYVCCIYATAALIEHNYIQLGFKRLIEQKASFAIAVTNFPYPIQRSLKLNKNQNIEMMNPKNFKKRSQDLEDFFHDAGQFYWGKASSWLNTESIFNENSIPIFLPRYKAQDIDTLEDWEQAEILFKSLKKITNK